MRVLLGRKYLLRNYEGFYFMCEASTLVLIVITAETLTARNDTCFIHSFI